MDHSHGTKKQSWCDHFPLIKIKGVLKTQEEVGQLREPVVRLVSAASALFINDLVKNAQPADGKLITLADLKRAVQGSEPYSAMLDGVLENCDDVDDRNPYQAVTATKSTKRNSSSSNAAISDKKRIKSDTLIQEAMNLKDQINEQKPPSNDELVLDDDDYD